MSYYKGEPMKSGMTVQEVKDLPLAKGIPERGLTPDTCKHFGIRSEFSEVDGKSIAHYFPVTKEGALSGWIRRDLRKPKKEGFSTVGDVSVDCDLLGQANAPTSKKVFIVEGVYDAPSLYQALYDSDWNNK